MAERTPAMDVELASRRSARTLGGPAVTASHDARQAMTERVGGAMAVAALAADMPDGRTIAQWLDDLAALETACRQVQTHGEHTCDWEPCPANALCGDCWRPWPCPTESVRRLLPEARS